MTVYLKKFNELTTMELYKILQARSTIFIVEQQKIYLDMDGKDLEAMHLFIKDQEEIIGYLRILPPGVIYEEASIGRVIVNQNYRGQKLAQQLLTKAISYCIEEMGETKIKIQAQSRLENFYRTFGFESISEAYNHNEVLHTDMLLQKR